jgi:NAD(P)-dependent dehydrogenase (short-subunit alcohol dehydrogenase family)
MSRTDPFTIAGNKYLITGAASGIGRATSILLSGMGADLILVDIDSEGLSETRKYCRNTDKIVQINLGTASLIKDAIMDAVSDFGKLNGFVHSAGKSYISPLKSISEEKCNDIYAINTYAAIELAKVFTNRNVYSGQKGSIVFISSVYGLVGSSANVGYAMSKAALHGITKSLAVELAPKNIRVNCVAPGFIKTNMLDKTENIFNRDHSDLLQKMHPLGMGEANDIASAIAFLLSDGSKWITGTILSVDGGFTAQ